MSLPFDQSVFKKLMANTQSILAESRAEKPVLAESKDGSPVGVEAAKHVEGQSPAPAAKSEPGEASTQGRKAVEVVGGDNSIPKDQQSAAPAAHKEGGEASSQGPREVRSVSEWHDRMLELASLEEMTGPEVAKHVTGQSPAPEAKAKEGGQAIQQGPTAARSVAGETSGEEAAKHVEGQAKAPVETLPAQAGAATGKKTVAEAIEELAKYSNKVVTLAS